MSVNVNKVATLRNARGKNLPDVVETAVKIIEFGGQGITVHPRPDGRHIRWPDVQDLKAQISVELNIEGYPSDHFIEKVIQINPAQCTLVPDPPEVLTSNAGWRLAGNEEKLRDALSKLKAKGIRISLFVDPTEIDMKELIAFRDMGADRVELYTEAYADNFREEKQDEVLADFQKCAQLAHSMGLGVNAGHDLNLKNLAHFSQNIPELKEVSIGHALVCDALDFGWQQTIQKYLDCLK
ncbi:MAG: pyridoxine 5'-phosphate synthase [Bdellovibrionales bacterium]|nr:pyridoxine 5'-phosphate synthase [Bdellovibrionales bacterium]